VTIKITQVSVSTGEVVLTVSYDNPKGSGQLSIFQLRKQDLVDQLIDIRRLLGRLLTLTDAKQVLVSIINGVRSGQSGIPEDFDFAPYIGVELES
jgi:hypothetical protein